MVPRNNTTRITSRAPCVSDQSRVGSTTCIAVVAPYAHAAFKRNTGVVGRTIKVPCSGQVFLQLRSRSLGLPVKGLTDRLYPQSKPYNTLTPRSEQRGAWPSYGAAYMPGPNVLTLFGLQFGFGDKTPKFQVFCPPKRDCSPKRVSSL